MYHGPQWRRYCRLTCLDATPTLICARNARAVLRGERSALAWWERETGERGGCRWRGEAGDDDVAEGAQTMVFQVDDTPKGAKDAELIRKGKTWSLK